MRQGSLSEGRLGEGSRLRQLLQDLLQVLGDFSKRGTGAGFHLMGKDSAAPLGAQEEGKFPRT